MCLRSQPHTALSLLQVLVRPSPTRGEGVATGTAKEKKFGRRQKMPIKYDELMALKNLGQKYAYTDREVMLYAYGIGMGADPMDETELAFANEFAANPPPLILVTCLSCVPAWGSGHCEA